MERDGTTTLSESGAGSNGNEEVLLIPQSSKTEASSSGSLKFEFCLMAYQLMWINLMG